MKEYALVPDSLLKKTAELKRWVSLNCDPIATLEPKATMRKAFSLRLLSRRNAIRLSD